MMTQWENAVTVRAQVSHDPVIPLLPPHSARNSLFGSALRDQKPHDFNTSPSKTEGTVGELRAKFWGRGSISDQDEDRSRTRPETGQGQRQDEARNRTRPGRARTQNEGLPSAPARQGRRRSDLCEVRDLGVRQLDEVKWTQLYAHSPATARHQHRFMIQT